MAYRISGLTRLYFGDYAEARANIEKALAILDSERDRDLAFRFGQDQVAAAMIYLALVLWPLGDVERARQFADQAASQATKSGNVQTLAYVNYHLCLFEALRGDRERAAPVAKAVLDLAREHAMPIWESAGRLFHGWANWLVGDQQMELAEMRRGIERWRELGQAFHRPYLGALLAEAEASAGNLDIAIGELDRFLAEAQSTGERWSDPELHRVRGELLIKRNPANTAPAEEAFLTAIAVAQQQRARSFELRAALSLAKLYQSTGRVADAHAVLAPRSKTFRRRWNSRRSRRRKRCSPPWRREIVGRQPTSGFGPPHHFGSNRSRADRKRAAPRPARLQPPLVQRDQPAATQALIRTVRSSFREPKQKRWSTTAEDRSLVQT